MRPRTAACIALAALLAAAPTPGPATAAEAANDGAEFLRSVIQKLRQERGPAPNAAPAPAPDPQPQPQEHSQAHHHPQTSPEAHPHPNAITGDAKHHYKITAPTPVPEHMVAEMAAAAAPAAVSAAIVHAPAAVPPPPLSKAELLALYRTAAAKGASLPPDILHKLQGAIAAGDKPAAGRLPGYYYYYYPLKSFMSADGHSMGHEAQASSPQAAKGAGGPPASAHMVPTAMMVMEGEGGERGVEPLFVAMAGFVGAALAFAASVLFLPRLGPLRAARSPAALLPAALRPADELAALAAVAGATAMGRDCSERLACEAGRAARRWQLDGRPLRILEIMLPPEWGRQVAEVRKAAARRENCRFISCKSTKYT